jgi:exodeoxyribonuclease VII small subunit
MKDMSFEKALKELEDIVDKLEGSELSLDESLGLFEKGVQLARFLRQELEKAERKVEILLQDEKGELKPETFDLNSGKQERGEQSENTPQDRSEEEDDIPF